MFSKKQSTQNSSDDKDVVLEPTEEETGEENLREKLKDLREKLKTCSRERTEYLSGWQRAKADYVNLQKESEAWHGKGAELALARTVSDIIPVLDSFEMAMADKETWEATPENWRKGVEHIYNQLKAVLSNHGLKEICPKEGDGVEFQHHTVAEAVSTDKKEDDGKISAVLQKGYSLNGKVLRPARVTAFLYKG